MITIWDQILFWGVATLILVLMGWLLFRGVFQPAKELVRKRGWVALLAAAVGFAVLLAPRALRAWHNSVN